MFTLFHHPFCPHSRFVRLVLGEYGLDLQLVEERVWERREAFLLLNPAGTVHGGLAATMLDLPGRATAFPMEAAFRIVFPGSIEETSRSKSKINASPASRYWVETRIPTSERGTLWGAGADPAAIATGDPIATFFPIVARA